MASTSIANFALDETATSSDTKTAVGTNYDESEKRVEEDKEAN